MPRPELRALHLRFPGQVERRWLSVLLTDLAVDAKGRATQTPFTAPSGKQNLRTFFENSTVEVRNARERITEALTGWRRVPAFNGEYLDHRVLQSTADHPKGKEKQEAGVPVCDLVGDHGAAVASTDRGRSGIGDRNAVAADSGSAAARHGVAAVASAARRVRGPDAD